MKRVLVVVACVGGLLSPQAVSAQAVDVWNFVVAGTATTSGSLSAPVAPSCGVNPCPSPGHVNVWFSAQGVGAGVTTAPTAVAGPTVSVHGSGSVGPGLLVGGPWCGHSTGSVVAHWSATGLTPGHHGSAVLHWTASAGAVLVMTGTGVAAVVAAVPPTPVLTPAQSCLTGTAATFTIVGAVVGLT